MAYRDPRTLTTIDVQRLLSELEAVRLAAIVGDHGTGKSTLLHSIAGELEARFADGRWVQLTREIGWAFPQRCREIATNIQVTLREQKALAAGGVLVIDGAEQLPSWARSIIAKRTRQRGQACLITTHQPVKRFETIYRTSLNPKLIKFLADQLTSGLDNPELIESVGKRITQPIDNARLVWSDLYDVFEQHVFEQDHLVRRTSPPNKGDQWPSA